MLNCKIFYRWFIKKFCNIYFISQLELIDFSFVKMKNKVQLPFKRFSKKNIIQI